MDIINDTHTNSIRAYPNATKEWRILTANFNVFLRESDIKKTIDLSLLFIPSCPVLIENSQREIKELFALLDARPHVDAIIHGHVCCTDDYILSYDRALMVYRYLTQRGIGKERLEYIGHSNSDPKVFPEITEADRLSNRRVTVDFIKN